MKREILHFGETSVSVEGRLRGNSGEASTGDRVFARFADLDRERERESQKRERRWHD